jgi:hypothetical protein
MDRLRRSLRDSFRRRKDHVPESSKPHMWQADEAAVRAGTCSFNVKVRSRLIIRYFTLVHSLEAQLLLSSCRGGFGYTQSGFVVVCLLFALDYCGQRC